MEIPEICRTCLDLNGPFLSIYDDSTTCSLAYDLISCFTRTKPKRTDGLSDKVCHSCFIKIDYCFSFWKKCEQSDKILRQRLLVAMANAQKPCPKTMLAVEQILEGQKDDAEAQTSKSEKLVQLNEKMHGQAEPHIENEADKSELIEPMLDFGNKDVSEVVALLDQRNLTINRSLNVKFEDENESVTARYEIHIIDDEQKTQEPNALREAQTKSNTNLSQEKQQSTSSKKKKFNCERKSEHLFYKRKHASAHPIKHQSDFYAKSKSNLQHNKRLHSEEKPFQCSFCNKSFAMKSTMRRHQHIHSGDKPFKCNQCNYSFAKKSILQSHIRVHSGDKPFQCSFCSKSFEEKVKFRKHERMHTVVKQYQCNQCDFSFAFKSTLQSHVRIHTGEKPFKCSYCSKSFAQNNNLTAHELTHTVKKPIQYSHSSLQNQMRSHIVEKPFHCKFCTKSYRVMSSLRRHQRSHSGVKPFKCSFCSKVFVRMLNLKIHLNRAHQQEELTDAIAQDINVKLEVCMGEDPLMKEKEVLKTNEVICKQEQVAEVLIKLEPEEEEAYNAEKLSHETKKLT